MSRAETWDRLPACRQRRQAASRSHVRPPTAIHSGGASTIVSHSSTADVFQYLDAAADPADFHPVDAVVMAQAEVQTAAEVTLVSAAAVDLVDLADVAGDHPHPRRPRRPGSSACPAGGFEASGSGSRIRRAGSARRSAAPGNSGPRRRGRRRYPGHRRPRRVRRAGAGG